MKPTQSSKNGNHVKAPDSSSKPSTFEHPVFDFRIIQKNYGLDNCEKKEKSALIDQLHALSKLSWNEIRSSGRHGLGCEKIKRSCIKASIPDEVTEDIDIIAFRFCGKKAMLGYRTENIFRILWLDTKFSVYDHS